MVKGLEVCQKEPQHEIKVVLARYVVLSFLSWNDWDRMGQLLLNALEKSACQECDIRVFEDPHHFGIFALSIC